MFLITFTGLDGSGKTTQLEILKKKLTEKKIPFSSFHIIDFSLANQLARKAQKKENPSANTSANKITLFLRKIFLLIDLIRFRFFLKSMREKKNVFLLADRYFFDQIANIFFLSQKPIPLQKPLWQKMAEKFLVLPTTGFYLSISPKNVQDRERKPEQNSNYLEKKRIILDKLSVDWNLTVIPAQQKKEIVAQLIWQKIEKILI